MTQWRNTSKKYGLIAILLHWIAAVWIIALFALGIYMMELSYYDAWYRTAPHWHKSMGILLAVTIMFRFFWRGINPKPQIEGDKRLATVAELVHGLMYLWVGAVIATGYLISTADGRAIDVFGWFSIPATITGLTNQAEIAGVMHWYLALGLIVMASLHGVAALKRHFIDKDGTLSKMSPLSR